MMTCRELAELLIDYVSGELAPEHRQRLDHHLGVCPPCAVYLQTYKLTIKLTGRLPDAPVPQALKEKLCAALEEMRRAQAGGGRGS
jgi:anti-sigma factor RsiW